MKKKEKKEEKKVPQPVNSKVVIIVLAIVAAIILFVNSNESAIEFISQIKEGNLSVLTISENAEEAPPAQVPLQYKAYTPPVVKGEAVLAKKLPSAQPVEADVEKEKVEQEKMKNEFLEKVKVNMNFPEHLNYSVLDLEQGIEAIQGTSLRGEEALTIAATARIISLKDVLEYLSNPEKAFPQVRPGDFNPGSPVQKIMPPQGKGISSIQIISGKKGGTDEVYAAYIERTDRKGSYLFIMKAPKKTFAENEGYLDQIMNNFEAK